MIARFYAGRVHVLGAWAASNRHDFRCEAKWRRRVRKAFGLDVLFQAVLAFDGMEIARRAAPPITHAGWRSILSEVKDTVGAIDLSRVNFRELQLILVLRFVFRLFDAF